MNKEKTYKEKETEKQRGRKRFIERVAEDKEASQEIKDFLNNNTEKEDYDGRPDLRPFS